MKRGSSAVRGQERAADGQEECHDVTEKKMRTGNADEESEMAAHLKLEDVRYMLRALEEDAYSSIVSALRAQGPLTEYKKALLDHLKASLFISAERHKAEIRRAANDDLLLIISKKMNPMCDPYHDWYLEGSQLGRINPTPSMATKASIATPGQESAKKIAERLSKRASEHNQNLTEGERALLHLIQLPKKPQVPETLKYLMNHGASTSKKAGPKLVTKATSPMKNAHRSPARANRKEAVAERKRKESETRPKPKVEEVEETSSNSAAESVSETASRSATPSSVVVSEAAAAGQAHAARGNDSSTAAEVVSAVASATTKMSTQVPTVHSPIKNGPSPLMPPQMVPGAANTYQQQPPDIQLKSQSRAKAVKKVSSANPNLKTVSPKRGAAPVPGPPGSPRGVKTPTTTASWPTSTPTTTTTQKRTTFPGPPAGTAKVKTEGAPTVPAKGPSTTGTKPSIAPPRGEPVMRCARVEPFLFPAAPPGSNQKPPRGNPDKRVKKHPNIVPGLMRTAGRSVGSLGTVGSTSSLKRRKPPLFYDEIPVPEGQDPSSTNVDDYIYSCLPHRRERRPVAEYYGSYYSGSGTASGTMGRSVSGTTIVRGSPSTPRYTTTTAQYHSPFYASGATAARLTATGVAPNAAVQAAYSSPTRPYYGNPSAAALGITVRPTGDGGKPVVTAQQHSAASTHNSANSTDKIYLMRQPSTTTGNGGASGTSNPTDLAITNTPTNSVPGSSVYSGNEAPRHVTSAPAGQPQLIAPKPASTQPSQQVILTGHQHHHGVANGPGGNGNVVIVRRVPGERRTSVSSPVGFASSNPGLKIPGPSVNQVGPGEISKAPAAPTVFISAAPNNVEDVALSFANAERELLSHSEIVNESIPSQEVDVPTSVIDAPHFTQPALGTAPESDPQNIEQL